MKTSPRIYPFAFLFLLSLLAASAYVYSQEETSPKRNLFMRAKLVHAQEVLEGIVNEDYDQIAKNGQQLALLSLDAQWQVLQSPEYVRRSAEFRRDVNLLTEAAREKNLDRATLAYVKVTFHCVDCHKYIRTSP